MKCRNFLLSVGCSSLSLLLNLPLTYGSNHSLEGNLENEKKPSKVAPEPGFKEKLEHIKKINSLIFTHQDSAVIILGNTKDGKSSLFNYLVGKSLISKKVNRREFRVKVPKPVEGARVSHKIDSETRLPVSMGGYWDCPGFEDTGGDWQKLINAYSIYRLTRYIKDLKVLVVISDRNYDSAKGQEFLKILNRLGDIFPDLDELTKALCLVITKSTDLNQDDVKEDLTRVLRQNSTSLGYNRSKLIKFLCSSENHIAFFHAPSKEGPIDDEDKISIIKHIDALQPISRPKLKITVDENYIRVLASELVTEINKFISDPFCQAIKKYSEQLIEKHIGPAKDLRNSLKNLSSRLQDIFSPTPYPLMTGMTRGSFLAKQPLLNYLLFPKESTTFIMGLEKVHNILKMFGESAKSLEEFFSIQHFLFTFLQEAYDQSAQVKDSLHRWRENISPYHREIEFLTTEPDDPTQEQDGSFTFRGIIMDTEECKMDELPREINIYALKSLFIRENLNFPGVNLTIISPEWHIIGERQINLKGKPGDDHEIKKGKNGNVGCPGEDGEPGLPGQSGGNFYGEGKKFYDLSLLTLNIKGGKGGQGQDGGDGGRGEDGKDGPREGVEKRQKEFLVFRKNIGYQGILEKGFKSLTVNGKFREIYKSGTVGKKGENAGSRGEGGIGGRSGRVILNSEVQNHLKILGGEGQTGSSGLSGKPGPGGKNGLQYRGVYINEVFLPILRKEYREKGDVTTAILQFINYTLRMAGVTTVSSNVGQQMSGTWLEYRSPIFERNTSQIVTTTTEVLDHRIGPMSYADTIGRKVFPQMLKYVKETFDKTGQDISKEMFSMETFSIIEEEVFKGYLDSRGTSFANIGQESLEKVKNNISIGVLKSLVETVKLQSPDLDLSEFDFIKSLNFEQMAEDAVNEAERKLNVEVLKAFGPALLMKGAGWLVTPAISLASLYFSSGWEEKPAFIKNGIKYAPFGDINENTNDQDRKEPEKASSIDLKGKQRFYEEFYNKKNPKEFLEKFDFSSPPHPEFKTKGQVYKVNSLKERLVQQTNARESKEEKPSSHPKESSSSNLDPKPTDTSISSLLKKAPKEPYLTSSEHKEKLQVFQNVYTPGPQYAEKKSHRSFYSGVLNNKVIKFQKDKILGDGNCGFSCLGMKRAEAVQELLKHKTDPTIRSLLLPEIKELFVQKKLPQRMQGAGEFLYQKYNETREEIDKLVRKLNDHYFPNAEKERKNHENLLLFLEERKEFEDASRLKALFSQEESILKDKFEQIYETEKCYEIFIKDFIGDKNNWLGYVQSGTGVLDAIAQIRKMNVYVWRKYKDKEKNLRIVHSFQRKNFKDTKHLLHTGYLGELTHFDLLSEIKDGENSES